MSAVLETINKHNELESYIEDSLLEFTGKSIGLAVSGGGDSLALLHATVSWARKAKIEVKVATVDHGLRAKSAEEALFVKETCAKLLFEHAVLFWNKPKKIKNLQNSAREARLDLLTEWAKVEKVSTILLGHSADDQVETILMNFIRGSGLEGLRGMPSKFKYGNITYL